MTGRQGGNRTVHLPIMSKDRATSAVAVDPGDTTSSIVIWRNLFHDTDVIRAKLLELGAKPDEMHGDLMVIRSALKRMLAGTDRLIAVEESEPGPRGSE